LLVLCVLDVVLAVTTGLTGVMTFARAEGFGPSVADTVPDAAIGFAAASQCIIGVISSPREPS